MLPRLVGGYGNWLVRTVSGTRRRNRRPPAMWLGVKREG